MEPQIKPASLAEAELPPAQPAKAQHRQTLGEIAYNAYVRLRGGKSVEGQALPTWDRQEADLQKAWEGAGKAVLSAVTTDEYFVDDEKDTFKTLVREKMAAGLPRHSAESVARTQINLDRERAEAAAKAKQDKPKAKA